MSRTHPKHLIGLVVLAMTGIVGSDAAGKILTGQGLSPFFVAWARFALAFVLIAPFCSVERHEVKYLFRWQIIFRAALIAVAIACILTALRTEQMGNVFGGFLSDQLSRTFCRQSC